MIYEMSQSLRKSGLCRRDMKKDFGMLINGLCEDCKEPCGADNFTAWLFNADNFFTAMAAWIKEEEK